MAYSVSFITNYIGSLLESDIHLKRLEVEGEISNITYHKSGNLYFTLKDEGAIVSCVMYKSDADKLTRKMRTGDKITVAGRISIYRPRGSYQIIVRSVQTFGEGELYKRFMELKEELSERGMFDESYKRPIPKYIKRLGVVTSPTGAAVRDIINITSRRNPYVQIILYPALVQGEGAAASIADGIMSLDELGVDVMIVGRGGGSMEDLWAFNEEIVAEAIFACDTPVISAVGHETDFTIADFVSDLRAPTPSAAAELGVYDVFELKGTLTASRGRLDLSINRAIDYKRQKALSRQRHLLALSPQNRLKTNKMKLVEQNKRLNIAIRASINSNRERMKRAAAGLSALSPAARLSQGYSYVTNKDGRNIYRKDDVKKGDALSIKVTDGEIKAKVTEVI